MRVTAIILLTAFLAVGCFENVDAKQDQPAPTLSVMAWNIWHGGKEDGENVGPQRVVDVIRDSKADLVAMQETYGSGELISEALEFTFHPRGTNVSIHSRFPVIEDISVFEEFKCVGALIELPDKRRVAFYSIWLPYNKEIWEEETRDVTQPETMLAACQASCDDLKKIKLLIDERLGNEKYKNVPVIIAGDFNSMSHLDYIESAQDQFKTVIDWPTSHVLLDDGFRDSWRELHPEVNRGIDRTWSPRFPKQQQDRIDYIYYQGAGLNARESIVIDSHEEKFPSDHAALLTRFDWVDQSIDSISVRIASYNIRHGEGTDGKLDIGRTAALLGNLNADIIGLQEVDNQVKRSGMIDQPTILGKSLGMNAAFGSFMNFQGGKYGMAILSRHPIIKQHAIELPEGNEPRVALACEIQLPNDQVVMAVNVHFDWVKDDKFRFAQAKTLAKFLSQLKIPYVLLGDFNDTIGSKTLNLLSKNTLAADKSKTDRLTFSSTDPKSEIDFIFAAPRQSWRLGSCNVLDAPKTSDHRPVVAVMELLKEK